MSKRTYRTVRILFGKCGVKMESYTKCRHHMNGFVVNDVDIKTCGIKGCVCAIASIVDLVKTMYKHASTHELIVKNDVLTHEVLTKLISCLKAESEECYGSLDELKDTILLRMSLGNYKSVADTNGERASFFIMNMFAERENPLFEVPFALWQGGECRKIITRHLGDCEGFPYYHTERKDTVLNELAYACQEGLTLEGPDGARKNFNVIVVFVPDL